MVDYLNIAYFPSICMRHILSWIKNTEDIAEMNAVRGFGLETRREKSVELPFIKETRTTMRTIRLTFRGKDRASIKSGGWGFFPVKKVFEEMKKYRTEDLVINRIVLTNRDPALWEMFKHSVRVKRPLNKWEKCMVVTLRNVSQKKAPTSLKNQIMGVMGHEIERLKFKIATLDLVRLENYPDWKANLGKNLIPKVNQDTAILKSALDPIFEEGYRHIRTYVRRSKASWEFLQSSTF